MLGDIRRALSNKDHDGVRRSAHALKGAAGYLGSESLALAAEALEMMAAGHNLADADAALARIESMTGHLHHSLSGHISHGGV